MNLELQQGEDPGEWMIDLKKMVINLKEAGRKMEEQELMEKIMASLTDDYYPAV